MLEKAGDMLENAGKLKTKSKKGENIIETSRQHHRCKSNQSRKVEQIVRGSVIESRQSVSDRVKTKFQ